MHERQEKQMKNELEKFAVGAGTACTVVLSELFFTTGTGCTGICGNCGGTCAGGIIPCNLNSVVYHKEGASAGGNTKDKNTKSKISDYYSIRNRVLFTKKYFIEYLPTVYLGLILTIVNRVRRKQYNRVWMVLKIMLIEK